MLIPRFETEDLVREAIRIAKTESFDTLVDIGTGSGIIPISILSQVHIPDAYALDISPKALSVTQENNQNLSTSNLKLLLSDLLTVFIQSDDPEYRTSFCDKNLLLTANLPYIRDDDWENMSQDTKYEPSLALFGGQRTGFELYERLFVQVPIFLEKYHPRSFTLLIEMGEDQEEIAQKVLEPFGWKFSFFADAFGMRRFIRIQSP